MPCRSFISDLYHSHFGPLRSFLEARTRCRDTAADLAQETFVRMMGLNELPQNPVGYAYQIARNLAVDHGRYCGIRRHEEFSDETQSSRVQPDAESLSYQRQRLALIEAAIAELPPQCRRVFVLHRFGELSQVEVAKELGISRQMVEKHVSKALTHLHQRLGEHTVR